MKKFVQIYNGKAHYIFEADDKPVFHPSIVLIDITNRDDIQEGWVYDSETGKFIEPLEINEPIEEVPPQPTLEEVAEETLLETKYQTFLLEMMI